MGNIVMDGNIVMGGNIVMDGDGYRVGTLRWPYCKG